jgi:hypothetical protein
MTSIGFTFHSQYGFQLSNWHLESTFLKDSISSARWWQYHFPNDFDKRIVDPKRVQEHNPPKQSTKLVSLFERNYKFNHKQVIIFIILDLSQFIANKES